MLPPSLILGKSTQISGLFAFGNISIQLVVLVTDSTTAKSVPVMQFIEQHLGSAPRIEDEQKRGSSVEARTGSVTGGVTGPADGSTTLSSKYTTLFCSVWLSI